MTGSPVGIDTLQATQAKPVAIVGVRDHDVSAPVFPAPACRISSSQVPLDSIPSSADNACCGLKRPVKGGAPASIEVAASSSKTVPVKSAPAPDPVGEEDACPIGSDQDKG
jgi:hypothetical protein